MHLNIEARKSISNYDVMIIELKPMECDENGTPYNSQSYWYENGKGDYYADLCLTVVESRKYPDSSWHESLEYYPNKARLEDLECMVKTLKRLEKRVTLHRDKYGIADSVTWVSVLADAMDVDGYVRQDEQTGEYRVYSLSEGQAYLRNAIYEFRHPEIAKTA